MFPSTCSTLPQIASQLELLHAHFKDISVSTSFQENRQSGGGQGVGALLEVILSVVWFMCC